MGKTHTVARGETIISLAHDNGFRAWEPLWMSSENEVLRQKRQSPHLLAAGDTIVIPEKETEEYPCETNLKHVFRVPSLKQWFQQTILLAGGEPAGVVRYELQAGGKTFTGVTADDSTVRHEIPLAAKTAELKVWRKGEINPLTWELQIGHLEPVSTVYGLKGRLKNLGYDCGEVSDGMDDKTKQALMQYQTDQQLRVTGVNDADTQASLENIHDRPVVS